MAKRCDNSEYVKAAGNREATELTGSSFEDGCTFYICTDSDIQAWAISLKESVERHLVAIELARFESVYGSVPSKMPTAEATEYKHALSLVEEFNKKYKVWMEEFYAHEYALFGDMYAQRRVHEIIDLFRKVACSIDAIAEHADSGGASEGPTVEDIPDPEKDQKAKKKLMRKMMPYVFFGAAGFFAYKAITE